MCSWWSYLSIRFGYWIWLWICVSILKIIIFCTVYSLRLSSLIQRCLAGRQKKVLYSMSFSSKHDFNCMFFDNFTVLQYFNKTAQKCKYHRFEFSQQIIFIFLLFYDYFKIKSVEAVQFKSYIEPAPFNSL